MKFLDHCIKEKANLTVIVEELQKEWISLIIYQWYNLYRLFQLIYSLFKDREKNLMNEITFTIFDHSNDS